MVDADAMVDANAAHPVDSLWDRLHAIPDRRGRKGRQYGLAAVMVLALAAMLAGANDLRAIFRWGRRLPPAALFLLGLERAPCHAMYHYFLRPWTWRPPRPCWETGCGGPTRSATWPSTASACAVPRRPVTTGARVCISWRPSPAGSAG